MTDPMDRSQRLMDCKRWRTFIRLLRLDDLTTSYTNAAPRCWPPRWWISTSTRPRDSSRHGAAPRRCSALGIPASMVRQAVSLRWALRLRRADEREIELALFLQRELRDAGRHSQAS